MPKVIVTWNDYPVDDDDFDEVTYVEEYDCENSKEVQSIISDLDARQYNGHEIVRIRRE